MHPEFERLVRDLDSKADALLASGTWSVENLPKEMPKSGVYLFSEGVSHLYVGRTNRMRKRLQSHCRPSSGQNQATFAFLLTREKLGKTKPSYREAGSRKDLLNDKEFMFEFQRAKERIRSMNVRFIEEEDQLKQALLEIYASVRLATPYNDFATH